MLSININNYQPNFRARLVMPGKASFEKYTGKQCAQQIEKARPTIEKIAKNATDMEVIEIYPIGWSPNLPLDNPVAQREVLAIGANDKYNTILKPFVTPAAAKDREAFADCIIRIVKDVIKCVKMGIG